MRRGRLLPDAAPNQGARRLRTIALRTKWERLEALTGINRDTLGRYARGVRHPAVEERVSLENSLGIAAESWFLT